MENPADRKLNDLRAKFEGWCKDPETQARWAKKTKPDKKPSTRIDLNETARNWFERQGYYAYRVDYYDHMQKIQRDFMGLFDYLLFRDGRTIACQITTKANISTRQKKIQDGQRKVDVLKGSGWEILLLGFYKQDNGRWAAEERWL